MKNKKQKRKIAKYQMGTGKQGMVRNYIESPDEAIAEHRINVAKSNEEAMSNPWVMALNTIGQMGVQYGTSQMGKYGGATAGAIQGGVGLASMENGTGPGGTGKPKKKQHNLTDDQASEVADLTGLSPEMAAEFFMTETMDTPDLPEVQLGKYGPVGYFDVKSQNAENIILNNTSRNPHSRESMGDLIKKIQKLNPDRTVSFEYMETGGTIGGPGGKVKTGKQQNELTDEQATEVAGLTGLGSDFAKEFFVTESDVVEDIPEVNLGKYGPVDYFNVVDNSLDSITLSNTKNNPHNRESMGDLIKKIRKLNPNREVNFEFMENGGQSGGVPAEIEGEEVVETPDGQVAKAKGPSHAEGGIKTELPKGTKVFSKKLKVAGKSMADRKLARERKLDNLLGKLEDNPTDKILQQTIEKTKKNNEAQELADMQVQEFANVLDNFYGFAYGTSSKGIGRYANGSSGIDDEDSPIDYAAIDKTFNNQGISDDASLFGAEEVDYKTPGFNPSLPKFEGNSMTGGDVVGMLGTAVSAFGPYLQTLKNRAEDTPNINAFEDFGQDAIDTNEEAQGYVEQQRDKALQDVEIARRGSTKRNRNTARGINTLRALDITADQNANRAIKDIYSQFAGKMMGLLSEKSSLENVRDKTVMSGEQARDLADRQDQDNYRTQLARNTANIGTAIQKTGRDLNVNKKNKDFMDILPDLSQYGLGYVYDENGDLVIEKVR